MAISEHASTPATVSFDSPVPTTLTTAAFSPPASSVLLARVGIGRTPFDDNASATVSDSSAQTWIAGPAINGQTINGLSALFYAYLPTAPGSITVTANYTSGASASGAFLDVTVLTGAASDQTGAGSATRRNTTATRSADGTLSVTTTQVDSQVYGITDNYERPDFSYTPNANTTIEDSVAGGEYEIISFKGSAATISPGATTYGGTWSGSTAIWAIAALEILPEIVEGPPTVNAGSDVTEHVVSTQFSRTATESENGFTITSRAWTIESGPAGVGSTIGTAAALSWTPTVTGAYVLQYSATNSEGTGTDDVTVTVEYPREATDLTLVGTTAWVAGTTSVAPTYPGSLAEGDIVYAVVHNRPNTVTPSTPANWELVGTAAGGGGSQGAGTGQTRITVFRRVVPGGGLSGSQSITVTSGNASQAHMRAYQATGTNVEYEETFTSYSRSTASTNIGGTAAAGLSLAEKDLVAIIVGSPDDTTTTMTVSAIAATGATFSALTRSPDVTAAVTGNGNDLGANAYEATVTDGSSSTTPVVTGTANVSETGMGFLFRVRATVEVIPPPTSLLILRRAPLGALIQL